jgi:hypothetical protein
VRAARHSVLRHNPLGVIVACAKASAWSTSVPRPGSSFAPIPVELVRTIGSNGILGQTTEYLLQGGSAMSIWGIQFVALLAFAFILVVMML